MNKREFARRIKQVYTLARERMEETAAKYGLDEVELRYLAKLEPILLAPSTDDAQAIANKVHDRFFTHCLALWSKKEIRGPITVGNYEKKARSAESLAKWLAEQGNEEASNRQYARAQRLRDELKQTLEASRG